MADDPGLSPPSLPTSPAKKPRGRPPSISTESTHKRIERLQAELRHAQESQKLAEQHQAELVGSIVLKHAASNEGFRHDLAVIIRMACTPKGDIKSKTDIAILRELAGELEPKA